MVVTVVGSYVLIAAFFLVQRWLRKGGTARSFEQDTADRGSTRFIGAAFGLSTLSLLASLLLNLVQWGSLPGGLLVGWIGLGIMCLGIALRAWAAIVLGSFYTSTLVTTGDQHIVRSGPYRVVRHPGYSGTLLLWLGAAMAASNWVALVTIVPIMAVAYGYRIHHEEAMLSSAFGDEYQDYSRRTWRLIPPIY